LNKEIIYVKTAAEEENDAKNMLKKELTYYKQKYEELTQSKGSLKDINQQLEVKVNEFQKDIIREASRNWEGLQAKYQQ
jgi:hypothetical protein